MAEGKCDQGAAIVELFVFNSRSDTGPLRPLLELLLAASDWPIRLECGTEQLAIEAIFSDNGILPRPGVVITESHPVFIATRVAALRHSLPRQDWIGFAVVIPRIGVVRDCVATVFPGTVAEVVLDASCVQPHWGTELLSRSCESTTSIATSGLSDAAWRLEAALLETDASASHGSTRARSDRLMGVLLELHKPTAAALPVTNNSRRTAASTTGKTEGYSDEGPDRSHDQRILRKAFHRRIIRDLFPESASSLLEADGTTLRTDLRMDAAYAPVLLEAAVGHLTRGVPGLKWILEPVMYAVMKPVLNNFVNLAAPTLQENMQEELQQRMVEQVPADTAMIAANGVVPQLIVATTDALSARLAESLAASLVSSLGGPLKQSVSATTAHSVAAELKETVTNRVVLGFKKHLLDTMPGRLSKALTGILAKSLPPALTATLTAALRPLRDLRARRSVASSVISTAASEACGRCATPSLASDAYEAACRLCALSRESAVELLDAGRDEGDRASHHFGSYYAGYYAEKNRKAGK